MFKQWIGSYFMASKNEVNIFIINPTTQSCLPILTHEHLQNNSFYDHKIGFVCDYGRNIMIYHFSDNLDEWCSNFNCKVYKEEVWKGKERFFTSRRNLRFDMFVHHRGVIYVISYCSHYLTRNNSYLDPTSCHTILKIVNQDC